MKSRTILLKFCSAALLGALLRTNDVSAQTKNPALYRSVDTEIEPEDVTTAAEGGLFYLTGFEPEEGFSVGFIGNDNQPAGCGGPANPCWGTTGNSNRSLLEGHIETAHPSSGTQHLRLSHDPTTRTNQPAFGLGVDARYPRTADLTVQPVTETTVSVDIAISGPNGQSFRIQPQSNSQNFVQGSVLFHETGEIFVLDDVCETAPLAFRPTGFQWETTGAYKNLTMWLNPFSNSIDYYYDSQLIYSGCTIAGTRFEQFLVFGDNYPGSHLDLDNLQISSIQQCRTVCGNGTATPFCEECDGLDDANCPGRCTADCTCLPICTAENPCPVSNGINGPYLSSSGYYQYSGDSPYLSVNGCGSSYDARIQIQPVSDTNTTLASNDDCDTGPYGAGADPSAPCFEGASGNHTGGCTCFENPGEPVLIWIPQYDGETPALGSTSVVEIRKKVECAGSSVGACCDTNGTDFGCTDNAVAAACVGADKVWTDQGKCDEVACECIPDCNGAACGDDGCGGNCGNCDDGNACNGVETCNANRTCDAATPLVCNDGNACNGVESCIPALGCMPGLLLLCDDGLFCNGIETCNPSLGCVPGTPVSCDDGIECTADTCVEPDGSCSHDDADCSIPTVSHWGLIVLALLLLVTAKVRFVRPRAAAS